MVAPSCVVAAAGIDTACLESGMPALFHRAAWNSAQGRMMKRDGSTVHPNFQLPLNPTGDA
jgi:hypothetical protein